MADKFSGVDVINACKGCLERSGGKLVAVDEAKAAVFADSIDLEAVLRGPPVQKAATRSEEASSAALLLCWNAINFSYYPDPGCARWYWRAPDGTDHGRDDEANGVVAALADANSEDALSSPSFLSSLTAARLASEVFKAAPGAGELPMLEERARALRELGDGLASLGQSPLEFVESARRSAARLVTVLTTTFPTYADVSADPFGAPGAHPPLNFHKRAQLCCSMLHSAGVGGGFDDLRELTVFADYRLPQLLRCADVGVLAVGPELASRIDADEPLAPASAEEVTLRAATIVAGDALTRALCRRGGEASAVSTAQLDYYLWREAVRRDELGGLPKFHKTRCTAY
jgi:hypothetical protein